MNKYMGFYELKRVGIPTVPWKIFEQSTVLDDKYLWTIRVAVENGNDLNLPRIVGVKAHEAQEKGLELQKKYGDSGIVVYYPYFIAEKSGVLDIGSSRTVIEGVQGDLWNLVTYGKKDLTVILNDNCINFEGNKSLLSEEELDKILDYAGLIKGKYRQNIVEGQSMLLEWSYAFDSDTNHKPVGEKYLVFYEMRSIG